MTVYEYLAGKEPLNSKYYKDNDFHLKTWLAPKDILLVSQFVTEQIRSFQKIIIYGAGTHTAALLENLSINARQKICYILDKYPKGRCFSVPVIRPEELLSINCEYDQIVLSHYDYEGSMHNTLLDIGIDDKKILPIYTNPEYLEYALGNHELPELLSVLKHEVPVIVFLSLRPTRKIFSEVGLHILKNIADMVAVNLDMGRDITTDPDAYDISYDCKRSLIILCDAIKLVRPDIIYVHDQIETYYLFIPLLKSCFPDIKIIWEPYDILRLMLDDYKILSEDKGLSEEEIDFLTSNENASLMLADGIVYKDVGVLAEKLMQEISNGSTLQYNQYLSKEHIASNKNTKKYSKPYKLVYAGSLDTSGQENVFTGDNYLVNPFENLLSQGLHLHLYINCTTSELESLYEDYHPLLQSYSSFKMMPRLEMNRLIRALEGKYHYGIQIGRCNKEILRVNRRRYQSTFSAKLWSYLFAGLPVIVNQELVGMAEFVNRYGIGLVVSCHDYAQLGNVIEKVSETQYAQMKVNVCNLTQAFCVESRTPKFWSYLKNLLDSSERE